MPNNLYFTPGPSQLFHSVPYHIQQALREDVGSISHRSSSFQSIVKEAKNSLIQLLDIPDNYKVFFTSSANEVWERIIQNLVEHSSHHYINGAFSKKFFSFAEDYQKSSTKHEVQDGSEFTDFKVPASTELISVTINETSVGYSFNLKNLEQLRTDYPGTLISADVVSSAPSVPLDLNLVDTAYFSVQKCFGLPSGLGVWLVNDRCIEKYQTLEEKKIITGSYHSLGSLLKMEEKDQTPETPNSLGIYLLMKVSQDMLERGIQMIRNETTYKSTLLYQAMDKIDWMEPFISNKANRSKTVCVAELKNGNEELLKYFREKKMIIGSGYGPYKKNHIRIANFPAHSKEQVEMLVDLFKEY